MLLSREEEILKTAFTLLKSKNSQPHTDEEWKSLYEEAVVNWEKEQQQNKEKAEGEEQPRAKRSRGALEEDQTFQNQTKKLIGKDQLVLNKTGEHSSEHNQKGTAYTEEDNSMVNLTFAGASPDHSVFSAGSSTNVPISTETNQMLFIRVSEATDYTDSSKYIKFSLSDLRPLGLDGKRTQGDHVTAYVNFLQILVSAVDDEKLYDAAKLITDAIDAILPDEQGKFKEILEKHKPNVDGSISRSLKENVLADLKNAVEDNNKKYDEVKLTQVRDTLNSGIRVPLIALLQEMSSEFLVIINQDKEIAFKREGTLDRKAAGKVKPAAHMLIAMNDLEVLTKENIQEMTDKDVDKKFKDIHDKYIDSKAKYIDGLNKACQNANFSGNISSNIRDKWIQAKNILEKKECLSSLCKSYNNARQIPLQSAHHLSAGSQEENSLVNQQFDQQISSISTAFGDLFDFKHGTHHASGYELLGRVTARHLVCMFRAFDSLQILDSNVRGKIIDKFLEEKVLKEQQWDQYKLSENKNLDLAVLKNAVLENASLETFKMLSTVELEDKIGMQDALTNLRRIEKADIVASTKQLKPKFIEILSKDLSDSDKELIGKLKLGHKTDLQTRKTTVKKISTNLQITFMAENDHKIDHRDNTTTLIAMVNANQVDSSTVICLERKEDGANFGMEDVRLLAKLLEQNQANPESIISINEQIRKSPIYQDALLYNTAKEKGIEVIGVEGKGLAHSQKSPEFNSTRENFMAGAIDKIVSGGKNVIFPVGSSHIDGLKNRLTAHKTSVDNEVARKNEQKAKFQNSFEKIKTKSTEFGVSSSTNLITHVLPSNISHKNGGVRR